MTTMQPPARSGFVLKPLHIVAFGIVLVSLVYGIFGMQNSFRSYTVSVNEAISADRSVQLAGFLGSTGEYDAAGRFTFLLQDENGELIKVISNEPRPANFEQAISIVAIGRYDAGEDALMAESLLVKCPSKYQEEMTGSSI